MEPAPADKPRNPYSPPAAVVVDEPEVRRERPQAVSRAVVIMWISLIVGVLTIAIDWRRLTATIPPVLLLGADSVEVAITAWLIIKIAAGRNWARITFLILDGLTILAGAPGIVDIAARSPVVGGLNLIILGLDLATLYLLFFPGRHFFKRQPR